MQNLFEEFQHLINQLPEDTPGASVELLLMQMEPTQSKLLKLCAIPHQFNLYICNHLNQK